MSPPKKNNGHHRLLDNQITIMLSNSCNGTAFASDTINAMAAADSVLAVTTPLQNGSRSTPS